MVQHRKEQAAGNGIFPFKDLPGATKKIDSSQRGREEKDRSQQAGARAKLSENWGKKFPRRVDKP